MGHGGFAPGGGVMDAVGGTALIDAIKAVVGANAGTDLFLPSFGDLAHNVRVGHVGTGHADHVDLA